MDADNPRFQKALLSLLEELHDISGREMIALTRAILRSDYTEEEFYQDFFSIFILIDDETGHIVLSGFGEYNVPTERLTIEQDHIGNYARIAKSMIKKKAYHSNEEIYSKEIKDIEDLYRSRFEISLMEFIRYFKLR